MLLASSEREAKQAVQSLLSLCHTLGIVINEKSDLVPSQTAKYLGMTIDTKAGKFFPSLARVEKFLTVAESFCTMDAPPARLWQVILGHLASLERLVPHGRLRMHSLQWHLKAHWSPESDPPSLLVPLPREVKRDLSWWMVRDHLLTRVRFGTPAPDLHLYSDVSCSGWGAHLLDQHVSGVWSNQEKLLHINLLEVKALFLGLQAFREDVIGHHVTAMCDNSTVVAYVNKQGVVRRPVASTDPTTFRPALVGQSASVASLQSLSPRRPRAEPSRVATLKRHFRKSGFSGRAAGVLSGCLRSSTSRLYQSRW